MDGSTMDMTRGKPWRLITAFAIPVLLSQVFQQLYNTADALIVGRFLGDEALAAVSSSGTLIFLIISFFTGMSMGASVTISRYFGAGDYARVSRAIHTNVLLAILCGIVLTVFGVALTPTFLRWMGTDPDVLPEAISYFRYYFFGILAVVMYNTCKGIMNALGDSRRPLYYLMFSSALNVVLDLLFIGVFHYGVGSAAVATVISQAVSALLCYVHLCKPGTLYQLQLKKIRFHPQLMLEVTRMGLPTGIQNSVIAFANVLVQSNINSFGSDAMAACGTYSKLQGFAFLPITSFAMALTTFISQNLGAREYDRAKRGARFGILATISMAEIIGIILAIFAPTLVRAFNSDPCVVSIAVQQARIESLFFLLLAFSHAVAGICRGAGRATVPMMVMLMVWCVFRIIFISVAMARWHDIRILFWAYPLTWSISSALFLVYLLKSDWVHGFEATAGRRVHLHFH